MKYSERQFCFFFVLFCGLVSYLFDVMTYIIVLSFNPQLWELVYQPVLPHGLIRINIRMRSIIIIIYLTLFSSIKYSNTYAKIYIYHYLVTINFILRTSICIQYIFSWIICLWIDILISSILHEYMVTYIVGSIFI